MKDPSETWTEGHSCQRFFQFAQWNWLFRVAEGAGARAEETAEERAAGRRAETMGEFLLQDLDRQKTKKKMKRQVMVGRYRSQVNLWLEHIA